MPIRGWLLIFNLTSLTFQDGLIKLTSGYQLLYKSRIPSSLTCLSKIVCSVRPSVVFLHWPVGLLRTIDSGLIKGWLQMERECFQQSQKEVSKAFRSLLHLFNFLPKKSLRKTMSVAADQAHGRLLSLFSFHQGQKLMRCYKMNQIQKDLSITEYLISTMRSFWDVCTLGWEEHSFTPSMNTYMYELSGATGGQSPCLYASEGSTEISNVHLSHATIVCLHSLLLEWNTWTWVIYEEYSLFDSWVWSLGILRHGSSIPGHLVRISCCIRTC